MKRLFLMIMAVLAFVYVNAQRTMVIQMTNGNTTSITIDNINNVSFDATSRAMIYKSTSGSQTSYSIDDVSKVYFEGSPSTTKDLSVSVNTACILNNSYTIEFSFGADVATRRIACYSSSSSLTSMSDSQLITYIENNVSSNTSDYCITTVGNLSENSKNYIAIITYDSSGNRGTLKKYSLTTATSTSQPRAIISNLTSSGTSWSWTITKNSYCSTYYMVFFTTSSYSNSYDSYIAYVASHQSKYTESTTWSTQSSTTACEVATWGLDSNGTLSGVIDKLVSSSSGAKAKVTDKLCNYDIDTCVNMKQTDVQNAIDNIKIIKVQ